MLLQLAVKNFLSYREEAVFSMVASKDKDCVNENTFRLDGKNNLLKNAVIIGANGSGKSNLFKAVMFMKKMVINSSKESQANELIDIENFRLSVETESEPSLIEIIFCINAIQYRYGFEINKQEIISEWLFASYTKRESTLFVREKQDIKLGNKFKEGKMLDAKTRKNSLFLSVVSQFNGEISTEIVKWFNNINIISGLLDTYSRTSIRILEDKELEKEGNLLKNLIKRSDIGIVDVQLETTKVDIEEFIKDLPFELTEPLKSKMKKDKFFEDKKLLFLHPKFNKNELVSNELFDLKNESEGTKQFINLIGPIIDTLSHNRILFIDEIDSSIHTKLLVELIKLIKSEIFKDSKAQIIFTTHNTSIFSYKLFRRDQIWLVEKDNYGATKLFSLVEFDEHVRKDASIEKNYLNGRYGAVPYIDFVSGGDDCGN